jgi:hypothetical protein
MHKKSLDWLKIMGKIELIDQGPLVKSSYPTKKALEV